MELARVLPHEENRTVEQNLIFAAFDAGEQSADPKPF